MKNILKKTLVALGCTVALAAISGEALACGGCCPPVDGSRNYYYAGRPFYYAMTDSHCYCGHWKHGCWYPKHCR